MGKIFFVELFSPVKILSLWNFYTHRFYTWLLSSTSSASWSSISCFTWYSKPLLSQSIAYWAWCRYCRTSTLNLRFCPILRDPYRWSYRLPPSQRPMLLWMACSKLRPRKLRSERSIMHTVRMCEYGTSTFDIRARAWRVHSRVPPTTSWWATRAVSEIKFGKIFVPIQSMSIEWNYYPVKILCYTVSWFTLVS